MEDWTTHIVLQVDEKLKDIKQRDLLFFRVDEFKRNVRRTDENSRTCPACNREKINIPLVVATIDEAISVPGRSRREYDRLINRLSSHMQKEHSYYTPYHFKYHYTFYGLVAGIAGGLLIMTLAGNQNWAIFSASVSAGLLIGYLRGGTKDQKIRQKKMLM
jgi:hypothetical protein